MGHDVVGGRVEFLFFDLNAFFASVEQQDDRRLRGRPVGVLPIASEHTCIIAASYEAKAFGVSTGTRVKDARRLCPQLVTVPARHEVYVAYHHRVMAAVEEVLPIDQVLSIDEAVCRLIGEERRPERALALAGAIKRQVAAEVGEALRLSIGLAPSRLLAKIASGMRKPDGLVLLTPESLPAAILHLPLSRVPGIGEGMEARLAARGVTSMEAFLRLEARQVRLVWGSVVGERLWRELRGEPLPALHTQRRSIGHSRVLDPATRAPETARLVARALTLKAATRMRRQGFAARALVLGARLESSRRWGDAGRRFPATRDSFVLLAALDLLWGAMLKGAGERRVNLVSVSLLDLVPDAERQGDLFSPPSEAWREALWTSIDALNARYGKGTVQLGSQARLDLAYLGFKIAFSRIPEGSELMD